jgi:hypothetical protein
MEIAWKRLSILGFSICAGIAGAVYGQPLIHNNETAVNVIVTVFSIFAGFLVAIMTIMGDPGAFSGRSWRANELNRGTVYNRLIRQKWMFILYLTTLGLIFAASLIKNILPDFLVWIERIYLGAAITAFILSLGLPSSLMEIQLARHDELIESKRRQVGIKN